MPALSSLMDGEIPPPATTPQVSFTLVQNFQCLHTALHRGTMTRPGKKGVPYLFSCYQIIQILENVIESIISTKYIFDWVPHMNRIIYII